MGIFIWIPKTASKRFRQKEFENSRIKNGRRPAQYIRLLKKKAISNSAIRVLTGIF